MENLNPLYSLQEMQPEQIGDDPLGVPEDVRQLRLDTINVLEGRVDINSFDEDYQKRMKDYYRFAARRMSSKYSKPAKRTRGTLDIV